MLELRQPQKRSKGRPINRPVLTTHQARMEAQRLLSSNRLSPAALDLIRTLGVAGVLTATQIQKVIDISPRSLQRYQSQHLIDRLPFMAPDLRNIGLDGDNTELRVYTLGIVGIAIAERSYSYVPSGYAGRVAHLVNHDLLANEVVLRMFVEALRRGFSFHWSNRYESTVRNENNVNILEPDAFVVAQRGEDRRLFCLELHNEFHSSRVERKVRRYERIYRTGFWKDTWETSAMPPVLAVFTHAVVSKGYRQHVSEAPRGIQCTFLGNPLSAVLDGNISSWYNFNTQAQVNIFDDDYSAFSSQ
jgi:hypothetical protein